MAGGSTAFLETCRAGPAGRTGAIPSGRRGHIWLFFEKAIPAALARKLGAHILTETMEHRPEWASIPTTVSFRIKTRFPKVASAI